MMCELEITCLTRSTTQPTRLALAALLHIIREARLAREAVAALDNRPDDMQHAGEDDVD
jgi:hypothetical protein